MIKQEIINILSDAREIHSMWLEYGHILVDSINVDNVEEPTNCFDCDLTQRLKTDGAAFSEQSWYKELQEVHEDLHKAYSDLYYESHRMYNPKTLEELMELFVTLESHAKTFEVKLDEIEVIFESMSDDDYQETLNNHKVIQPEKAETNIESVKIIEPDRTTQSDKSSDDDLMKPIEMDIIDIENLDDDLIDDDSEDSSEITTEVIAQTDIEEELDFENIDDENISEIKVEKHFETKEDEVEPVAQKRNKISAANVEQHISLKEQDIAQLIEEKELSQLELTHLEDRQKLTQKSVDQFDHYYALKQEEIASENDDNDQLLEFKASERKKTEEQLADINLQKVELNKEIDELKSQNEKDALELEEDQKSLDIKKQFDGLKKNKTVELDSLLAHLDNREIQLEKLKEEVSALEQEVSEIKEDISKKEHDLEDISEKEKLKNEERQLQIDEQDKITQGRLDIIEEKQSEVDELLEQTKNTQSELEVIEFQIEDLNKNAVIQAETNDGDLVTLNQQQDEKRHKLTEINNLQADKQQEIDEIDSRIQSAERVLKSMKAPSEESEEEIATA